MKAHFLLLIVIGCISALPGCGGSSSSETGPAENLDSSNGAANGPDVDAADDASVRKCFGVSLKELLAPVSHENPGGFDMKGSSLYMAIREARREDDPTLPLGNWAYELKRADWNSVASLALEGLLYQSKDLQLEVWLLDAAIHLHGFKGLKPALVVMRSLSKVYWNESYPVDPEQRSNQFRWVNEKTLPALRLIPITAEMGEGRAYSWADYEQARRNEQIKLLDPKACIEGVTLNLFNAAVSATPDDMIEELVSDLIGARRELDTLTLLLEERYVEEAPGFGALGGLLDEISETLRRELAKRGR